MLTDTMSNLIELANSTSSDSLIGKVLVLGKNTSVVAMLSKIISEDPERVGEYGQR